jgi:cobalt-zinc-cadmium resistance protein CzcA
MILVVIILFIFRGNVRGAIIVSLTIPFALLFASICLDLRHISANLLSLGALDFGMVVDGAVVMVESIVRHLNRPEEAPRTLVERIRTTAHEVQRPVFYAIAIIITAYLPIFTLQRVEGKLFKPMAWTVAFALLGALIFSMMIAPALASILFRRDAKQWQNPVMTFLTNRYRTTAHWATRHRLVTVGTAVVILMISRFLAFGGAIGSEFLPHLDEGAIWVRGTLPPSVGPTESARVADKARQILASFPEVPQVVNQIGRPDDGTDTTGFFDTEFFVDLLPKEKWRPVFHQDKERLIAAMDRELEERIPGVTWGFSQPISDNLEEAVSGVKGALAVKIYGDDLKTLEAKADEIVGTIQNIRGVEDIGVFRVIGQPNLNFTVDRDQASRYGINVSDVQDAIQTAVGGNAVSQVLIGEQRYDLVLRYLPQYRDTKEAIEKIRLLAPSGERVSAQLTKVKVLDGGSEIYRELPLTILLIYIILYSMFKSVKWALLVLTNIAMAPIGGLLALLIAHTNFSVSSGVGFLALFGVSVQIGVIMVEYINQLRARGYSPEEAAVEGAVLRLRPIMMTMLVATLGLLPAALSHGIGSDSQRPFAIVIVGGLVAGLIISIFLLPTLYTWFARSDDRLPEADPNDAV